MAKLKIKKNDVWIDMTPMSDVMVLLLTFFMLSANFVKNEIVKVQTPQSTNVDKVPATATLDIMIAPDTINKGTPDEKVLGRVYLGTDKVSTMDSALNQIMLKDELFKDVNKQMTDELRKLFLAETQIGVPMDGLVKYLSLKHEDKVAAMKSYGVPLDSIDGGPSEFQKWVQALKKGYSMWYKGLEAKKEKGEAIDVDLDNTPKKLEICLKADRNTPYVTFKKVISELQDILESRYKLVTQYKKEED